MLQCFQLALENVLLKVGKDENPGSGQSSSHIIFSPHAFGRQKCHSPHRGSDFLRCLPALPIIDFKPLDQEELSLP